MTTSNGTAVYSLNLTAKELEAIDRLLTQWREQKAARRGMPVVITLIDLGPVQIWAGVPAGLVTESQ